MKKIVRMFISGVSIIALLAVMAVGLYNKNSAVSYKDESDKKGQVYLASLENKDVAAIEQEIDSKKDALKQYDEADKKAVSAAKNSNIDFKSYYSNSVFMGDSITESIKEYKYLNDINVLAKKGQTLIQLEKSLNELYGIKPQKVFLLYGMNDVQLFKTCDEFKKKYYEVVKEVKKNIPKTQIYILSPLSVIDSKAVATDKAVNNKNLDQYRSAAVEVAKNESVNYIDINKLTMGKDSMHEPDGIHFKYDFYKVMLNYIHDEMENNKK